MWARLSTRLNQISSTISFCLFLNWLTLLFPILPFYIVQAIPGALVRYCIDSCTYRIQCWYENRRKHNMRLTVAADESRWHEISIIVARQTKTIYVHKAIHLIECIWNIEYALWSMSSEALCSLINGWAGDIENKQVYNFSLDGYGYERLRNGAETQHHELLDY